jgi:dinuclear metal center YbgI/SA1388 family protein
VTLNELDVYLRNLLRIDEFAADDVSQNGIQIERADKSVSHVAFTVDASLETARRAAECGAQVLVVHHGLFWSKSLLITGVHYGRIKEFLDRDLALYAVHLPLDQHETLGNNAVMADRLGLTDVAPFGEYHGKCIGWKGALPEDQTLEQINHRLFGPGTDVLGILPFGPEKVSTVGIVSGGAPWDVLQAIDQQLDLFITGDASHSIYHHCLEAGINVLFGGHYQTEVWGVQALRLRTAADLNLETTFIDLPTGL